MFAIININNNKGRGILHLIHIMKTQSILFITLMLCMTSMMYAMCIRDINLFAFFEIATLVNIVILIINLNKQK